MGGKDTRVARLAPLASEEKLWGVTPRVAAAWGSLARGYYRWHLRCQKYAIVPKTEIKMANLHQSLGHKRLGKISPDRCGYGFAFSNPFLLQHLDAARPF